MHAAALPLSVTLVVLAAAVTHATWNAIAHGIKDQLLAFGLIGAGGILVAIPLVIVSPFPLSACWPYLLASIVIHVFYNLLLMRSYRYGEFGQVYPLARGTSPLVVTVLAAVFAAERPSAAQVAGVLVVSCGLALLVLAGRTGRRAAAGGGLGWFWFCRARGRERSRAGGAARGGGDRADDRRLHHGRRPGGAAVRVVGGVHRLADAAGIAVRTRLGAGQAAARTAVGTSRRVLGSGLLAGGLSVLAYGLVLWAQTRGDLAPIAALRETSVIFGAVIGTVVFREPFGRWRIAATLLVVIGVLLLNVS